MKTKILLPVLAVIATLAIVFSLSAFKKSGNTPQQTFHQVKSKNTSVTWYFIGIPGQEHMPNKYSTDPGEFECGGSFGKLCSILDVPSTGNPNEPALTHGTPASGNYTTYQADFRLE